MQLQELTGQSQQRLSELRTQLEARGEQIVVSTAPGDTGATAERRPAAASADQMYEASLAQLRRGSTSTAPAGLREMLRAYPHSERGRRCAVLHRAELRRGEPRLGGGLLRPGGAEISQRPAAPARRCTTSGCWPSGGRQTRKAREAYQRVVQKYPQSDEAALARDRLKALGR